MISRIFSLAGVLALFASASQALAEEPQDQAERPSISEAIEASHNPAQLLQVANTAVLRDDAGIALKAMERLVEIRPFNPTYGLQLAALYAKANELSKAFDKLYKMAEQGVAADLDQLPGLEPLRQYPLYDHISDNMAQASEPSGELQAAVTVDRDDVSASDVVFQDGRYLVSSLRTGEVLAVAEDGSVEALVDAEAGAALGSVAGMAMDADGKHIWLAVNDLPQHVGYDATSVSEPKLVRIDDKGNVVRTVTLPEGEGPAQLADVAVAADGTVYAVDQRRAAIYSVASGQQQAELFGSAPNLTSLRALTLVDNDSKLIVADYALGLIVIDIETRQPAMVGAAENLNLGGIESLSITDTILMAVQPGFSPERLLRLELNEDLNIVSRGVVQGKALPEFMYPMRGTFAGDRFVFVANSYLPLLGAEGQYADGVERGNLVLLEASLDPESLPQAPEPPNMPPQSLRR